MSFNTNDSGMGYTVERFEFAMAYFRGHELLNSQSKHTTKNVKINTTAKMKLNFKSL